MDGVVIDEIAGIVEYRFAAVDLDALADMRAVAVVDIGTCLLYTSDAADE